MTGYPDPVELEDQEQCPKCGSENIVGDGCAWECLYCGHVWGVESRRPMPGSKPKRGVGRDG